MNDLSDESIKFLETLRIKEISDFELKKVNKDEYGNVISFIGYDNQEYIVIRKFLVSDPDKEIYVDEDIDSFIKELGRSDFLSKCKYRDRFICYEHIFLTKNKELILIYKKIKGEDLRAYWTENYSPSSVDFSLLVLIAYRLFSNLAILHKNGIYHRDIKPDNIIFNKDGTCHDFLKIIDFEFMCKKDCDDAVGTFGYMANTFIFKKIGVVMKNIDWEKADVISGIITIVKLYLFSFNFNVYDIDKKTQRYKLSDNIFVTLDKVFIDRNDKNPSFNYKIENPILVSLLDILGDPPKNLTAEFVLNEINRITKGCIPKEIKEIKM